MCYSINYTCFYNIYFYYLKNFNKEPETKNSYSLNNYSLKIWSVLLVMELINKKYNMIDKIGEGSFGSIYKGHNIRTNEYVAIKVEPIQNDTKLLKNESTIYHYLNNIKGIPAVKWFGKDNKNYYMVIELLGKSLQDLKNAQYILKLKLILQIGMQIIELLKQLHQKGLIHRDIKPDNFLFGLKNDINNIYIIDFGLCKTYIQNGKHILQKKTHSLIGSFTYASINAHNCIELSRRDDLESLGYMLIYFYLGSLSWQDISELVSNENKHNVIKDLKERLLETSNIPKVLIQYMNYVRKLDFQETPDYLLVINIFKNELEILKKNS